MEILNNLAGSPGNGRTCFSTSTNACADCYANIITQTDTQTIENVRLGLSSADDGNVDTVAVGNEGL